MPSTARGVRTPVCAINQPFPLGTVAHVARFLANTLATTLASAARGHAMPRAYLFMSISMALMPIRSVSSHASK